MSGVPSTLGRVALSATVGILMTVANACKPKEPPPPPEPTAPPATVPAPSPAPQSTLNTVTIGPLPCDINPPTPPELSLKNHDQVVWAPNPPTSHVSSVFFPTSLYPTNVTEDPLANMSAVAAGKQVTNPTSPQSINPNVFSGTVAPPYTYTYIPSLDGHACTDHTKYGRIIIKP
jgi:hypothetical protein